MSVAVLYSRGLSGLNAPLVTVEAHLAGGLPRFTIVGLAEAEVRESRDRVKAAIQNSGFSFPARVITVNLAPADLPKESGRFDLAIAIAILAASNQLPRESLHLYEFAGELALTGELRAVRGILAMTHKAYKDGRIFILPTENASEAALVKDAQVLPAHSLLDIYKHLTGIENLTPLDHQRVVLPVSSTETAALDLSDIRGQAQAKRALEIAAAGRHSLIMVGPPGTGKSMLAQRLPTLLPEMSEEEALDSAAIYSLKTDGFKLENWRKRPFRSPHHTSSGVALVGGGNVPRPGEISLAHHGVLFLDELPEFNRRAIEVLREPLEAGKITISRASEQAEFPASFQLVAAMNPCACGYLGHPSRPCVCTSNQIRAYQNKLSGPFLDRIDLKIDVPVISHEELMSSPKETPLLFETSEQVRARVQHAFLAQLKRQNKANALLTVSEIETFCRPTVEGKRLLEQAIQRLNLSARAYHRILKVARTIADLGGQDNIEIHDIAEAVQYRRFQEKSK